MIVDCAHYRDGKRQNEAPLPLEEAAKYCVGSGEFVWLGLKEPSDEELREVGEMFGLHELALEDAGNAHERPKLEDYDDSLFVVLKTTRYDDAKEEVEFGEIDVFVGSGYVITVRHGEARRVTLSAAVDGDTIMLRCEDDGRGFAETGNFTDAALRGGGFGPASILERVGELGGEVALSSGPQGATLTVKLPIGQATP